MKRRSSILSPQQYKTPRRRHKAHTTNYARRIALMLHSDQRHGWDRTNFFELWSRYVDKHVYHPAYSLISFNAFLTRSDHLKFRKSQHPQESIFVNFPRNLQFAAAVP